jgi:hypothetical protein
MSRTLGFALVSQHREEFANLINLVFYPPPTPDSASRPAGCDIHLEYIASFCARVAVYIISTMFISCLLVITLAWYAHGSQLKRFVKRLTEATPEEREQELMWLCKKMRIEIREKKQP